MDESGRIKLPAKLAFDVSNAGPGTLECKVSGRRVNPEKNGNRVRFEISGEGLNAGEHDFEIRLAGISLQEAPKRVISLGDQVILTGKGLAQAQCGEPAMFTIDGSKAGSGRYIYAVVQNISFMIGCLCRSIQSLDLSFCF